MWHDTGRVFSLVLYVFFLLPLLCGCIFTDFHCTFLFPFFLADGPLKLMGLISFAHGFIRDPQEL